MGRLGSLIALTLVACSGGGSTGTSGGASGGTSGGPPSSPLDCAWLASDNCYRTILAAADNCLPPASALGTLNASATACVYDGGDSITFANALVYPIPQSFELSFTVLQPDGGACLHYALTDQYGSYVLQSAAGEVVVTSTSATAKVTCPDGSSFYNANAFDLVNCDGGLDGLPLGGYSYSPAMGDAGVSVSTFSAFFGDVGGAETMTVFDCEMP